MEQGSRRNFDFRAGKDLLFFGLYLNLRQVFLHAKIFKFCVRKHSVFLFFIDLIYQHCPFPTFGL